MSGSGHMVAYDYESYIIVIASLWSVIFICFELSQTHTLIFKYVLGRNTHFVCVFFVGVQLVSHTLQYNVIMLLMCFLFG